MKKIFAVVLAVMITGSVFAMDFTKWNSSLEDSSWIIDAGVGYGLGVAVPVSAEYLLPIDFPIGVLVEVTPSWHNIRTGTGEYGSTQISNFWLNFLTGVNYHPDFGLENMDLYLGIKMGYAQLFQKITTVGGELYPGAGVEVPDTVSRASAGTFAFGTHIGFTYYFTDYIGIDVKAGYPTYISVSAAFKL